jgi:hypothetical protein
MRTTALTQQRLRSNLPQCFFAAEAHGVTFFIRAEEILDGTVFCFGLHCSSEGEFSEAGELRPAHRG